MLVKSRIAELSSGEPWVRKFEYPGIREILVVTWPLAPQGNQCEKNLFWFVWSLQPVFNLVINVDVMVILATRTFREKKQQQSL